MATSHFIGENFASDVPKDFSADADDKIVIDKLLVNKLIFQLVIRTTNYVVNLLKNHHCCWSLTKRMFLNRWERQKAV